MWHEPYTLNNSRIQTALERQRDAETNGFTAGEVGAFIGSLHHARTAAGADVVPEI